MIAYVQPAISEPAGVLTGAVVLRETAKWYGRKASELTSSVRTADVCWVRSVAMTLAYDLTMLSTPQVARLFNRKDHSSVIVAIKTVKDRMETERCTCQQLDEFQSLLLSKWLVFRKKEFTGKPLLVSAHNQLCHI